MISGLLSEVAAITDGKLLGTDRKFERVSTDTRRVAGDELFVALRGTHYNGHDYVIQAEQLHAAGALVEHVVAVHLPQIVVRDTRRALGAFAAHWRNGFDIPVVGITGSNGKTTTKEMVSSILRRHAETLSTRGNQNNDIGVPLTLLGLGPQHRAAVIEMGTNHRGEIAYLAGLTSPTVGVVTNAGMAHLEFLGSVHGVALEKGALYANLRPGGVAVINAEDAHADLWREMAQEHHQQTFGLQESADFHPGSDTLKQQPTGMWAYRLDSPLGEADIQLSLPGRHNVVNSLAAAAAAAAAGATLEDISSGLARVPVTAGRLIVLPGIRSSRLIDDTYNANPLSLKAAMEFALSLGDPVWLALGDMGELGTNAARLHADCGELARRLGVVRLLSFGSLSVHAAERFGSGAEHFLDVEALIKALHDSLRPGTTLLVKGSRSMRMERVVEALRASQSVGNTTGVG